MPLAPLLVALLLPAQAGEEAPKIPSRGAPAPAIPFEKFELANGLDVVLAEDHSVPFVWVNIWYGVGSKDEKPGRTGFAHLFEHLMFQGSQHMNDDYFVPLQKVGAQINGTTNLDRTNYFEGVPSEQLPLALWLESDRMGWLLPALTPDKLKNQQDVVRNERRQRYENRPYGMSWVWLLESLFPEGHPYHVPTIGKHEDIEAANLEDVKQFFSTWYLPSNASLTICGDFDPAEARALVERYFGHVPDGPAPSPVKEAPARLEKEVVVRKTDQVPHQKVWISWITPPVLSPGDADLDVLSNVLSSGKDSRLYRSLVQDKQIAKDISASQSSFMLQSVFTIEATAAAGHSTDEVVAEVDRVLAELRQQGPTAAEVELAQTEIEVGFFESIGSLQGKADLLNSYNMKTGNPGYLAQDRARYGLVTAATAQKAAQDYLPADRRVVMHITPGAKP